MKDLKISKELLSKVLNKKNIFGEIKSDSKNITFRYRYKCGGQLINGAEIINISDFAFRCKEWAFLKGFIISSFKERCYVNSYIMTFIDEFYGDTEIEAIFKACEWILKNEKNPK